MKISNRFIFVLATLALVIFAINLSGVARLEAQAQDDLESRVAALESRVDELEREVADHDWWINHLEDGQVRLFGFYANGVWVEIDPVLNDDTTKVLEFSVGDQVSSPVTSSGLWDIQMPFKVRLVDTETDVASEWVDLSRVLTSGDWMQIWCSPEENTMVSYWDESCLVINIQHLNGVYVGSWQLTD